jgi:HSP20 family molecular chaperone IbpA
MCFNFLDIYDFIYFFRLSPLTHVMHRSMPVEAIDNTCNSYKINIDVSGFKPEDIKVSLKDRVLTIDAKMEQKSEDGSRLYQEVSKTYTLPDNVELENLKSLLTNDGVLAIEAPLAIQDEMKPKEIPINRSEKSADK